MGPRGSLEMSVNNYQHQHMLRNIPEDRSPQETQFYKHITNITTQKFLKKNTSWSNHIIAVTKNIFDDWAK